MQRSDFFIKVTTFYYIVISGENLKEIDSQVQKLQGGGTLHLKHPVYCNQRRRRFLSAFLVFYVQK